MAYLVVENFSGGLDGRRHVLASKPGTLAKLRNGHVTRGGEVEKRKAFSNFAALPGGTFGLEVAGGKLWTFGSAVAPAMPDGVTYQRLQHPDGLAMTALVSGCAYGGKTFVIAEFSDGSRYAYFGGEIVDAFVDGVARPSMSNLAGFASHIAGLFPKNGYTCTASGNGIIITGPVGVEFMLDVSTTGTVNATMTKFQTAVPQIPGVSPKGSFLVSGGSETPAKTPSRTFRYIVADSLPGITGIYVNGIEVVGLSPGSTIKWNDYQNPNGEGDKGQRLGYTLAKYINDNTVNSRISATYVSGGGGWSGPDPGYITVKGDPIEGEDSNGNEVWIEFESAITPTYLNHFSELIETATINDSTYNPGTGRKLARFGVMSDGARNGISSIKVDGVEQISSFVNWLSSNTVTANAASDSINTSFASTDYLATSDAGRVTLTDGSSSFASGNGRVVAVTTVGNVVVSSVVNISGGVNPVGGVSQKNSIVLGGVFTAGSTVSLTITETRDPANPIYIGATRVGATKPNFVTTFKSKVQMLAGSSIYSSAVDNPTAWGLDGIGTSVIDLSNNTDGSEELISCAPYQGKLAIFSRRNCQVWNIDVDPAQNAQLQVLQNTGALSRNSATSYGEIDVFYLSDGGIRSLRARDASSQAIVNDVGIQVDNFILSEIRGQSDSALAAANAVIEPVDNRYMLAIGDKVYVLSQFMASSISAWSVYEPGFSIERMVVLAGRLYARSGNTVYLYGGADNNTYDSTELELVLPYLDAGKPAHRKTMQGIDLTVEGSWTLYVGMDPVAPEARDHIASPDQPTFSLGRILAVGMGTHFGIKMVSNTNGYARLANLLVHYEFNDAD